MQKLSTVHVDLDGYSCMCSGCAGGVSIMSDTFALVQGSELPSQAPTNSTGASGNQDIDGLLYGTKWAINNFTFSFPTSASFYDYNFNGEVNTFGTLSGAAQAVVRGAVLPQYAAVANLTFTEVTESSTTHADLRYADSDAPSTAWAYLPSTGEWGGDVWAHKTGTYGALYDSPVKGNYAYATYLHETGHALGLKHGHETGGPSNVAVTANHDSMEYTIMSYRSYVGASTSGGYTNETWGYAQTPMMLDVAALQYMYGANFTTNSSNTIYSWNSATGEMSIDGVGQGALGGNRILMNVWDGNGTDTYNFSNYTTNLSVDLNPGEWVNLGTQLADLDVLNPGTHIARGNISNSLLYNGDMRSLIENANGGSGNDSIIGNSANNILRGNAGTDTLSGLGGDDVLIGGSGSDTLIGGQGNETYEIDHTSDSIIENLNEGIDTVFAYANYTLSPNIETLVLAGSALTGTGNSIGNRIFGTGAANTLSGLGGDDVLIGGGGADSLIGGQGNDTYEVDNTSDTVTELIGEGSDTVFAYANYSLPANIETLVLAGSANTGTGNSTTNRIFGTGATDTLSGLGGDDVLIGGGGIDTLIGGQGNDTYEIDNMSDTVIESAGEGSDTVFAYANCTLQANVETLVLTGSASQGTGNGLNNLIIGNTNLACTMFGGAGDDILVGGIGADIFYGELGNDTFNGQAGSDMFVFSSSGFGIDAIFNFATAATAGSNHDVINLSGLGESFATLSITDGGAGAVITIDDDTITLVGILASQLAASDFVF